MLVLGDTNCCIAALMAKRMRIPVYHMEAGNRCFDENVPEETNRRLVDHVADFNLVYTEHARRNLLAEGLHPRRILLTGSPMREVLDAYRPDRRLRRSRTARARRAGGYFLVSAHREENVDSPDSARDAAGLPGRRCGRRWALPVLVSTHPRTRKRLEALGTGTSPDGIVFHEPFGFHDYNKLQLDAACVLSDSGTIAEESTILGFPAVTLRDSIERPEASTPARSHDRASTRRTSWRPSDSSWTRAPSARFRRTTKWTTALTVLFGSSSPPGADMLNGLVCGGRQQRRLHPRKVREWRDTCTDYRWSRLHRV